MLDLDAGLKWRGWSLEAEYYFAGWITSFWHVNLIDPAHPPEPYL